MKNFLLALVLVLMLALSGVASATNWGDTYNDNRSYTTNNEGGQGGKGGDADAVAISGSTSSAKSDADATAISLTNVKTDVKTDVKTVQGQIAINEGNKTDISIKNEKAYLAAPNAVGPAELNFGGGKLDWTFAGKIFTVDMPAYKKGEVIKQVVSSEANVKAKNLLPVLIKMVKKELPLCYNVRLIIIAAEAQKSWHSGGSIGGAGSGTLGTTGAAGSAGLVPSWGGTKADDLYTIIIVKIR